MATYLQSDCSIGLAAETVFGTYVAPSTHLEFTSETLQANQEFVQGAGLHAGSITDRFSRRVKGRINPSGDIVCDADSVTITPLLAAAFGSATPSGAGPYTRLFTPPVGDYLPSYTIQKGIPILGGTSVAAHNFLGMVCSQLALSAANNAIVSATTSWIGRDMETTTPLVTPAYAASSELFTFFGGSLTVGGTVTMPTSTTHATGGTAVANVTDFSLTYANGLSADDGFTFGGAGKRTRKPALMKRAITGQITAEFDATTLRDASLAGTGLALVLNLVSGADELQITLPKIVFASNVPASNGGSVITQQFDIAGLEDGTNPPICAWLKNSVAV